jgi:hypothetical protein
MSSIIFDFTVYVHIVYLGSSRALFSHSLVLFLHSVGQSAMRKEREIIISSCFLNIHIYTGLVLFSFPHPSCLPVETTIEREREKRKIRNSIYTKTNFFVSFHIYYIERYPHECT